MNGPQHYTEAEKCLRDAENAWYHNNSEFARHNLDLAGVHATLALAAAVAGLDASEGPAGGSTLGRRAEDGDAWDKALTP